MLARRCKKAFSVGKFLNSISSNYYNIQKIDSCALIKSKRNRTNQQLLIRGKNIQILCNFTEKRTV